MHPYYNSHIKQYRKEISSLCSVIRPELEELFPLDADSVVREIQDSFETKLLLDMPYVGGKKNSNDTSNLISCCEFAAFFVVGKGYGIAKDDIGHLIHKAWQLGEYHYESICHNRNSWNRFKFSGGIGGCSACKTRET